jgi:protein-S-isoprenylcysteine O-methyltransferase Ste14
MIGRKLVEAIVRASATKRSARFRHIALFLGALSFLVVVPGALTLASHWIQGRLTGETWRWVDVGLAVSALAVGLFFLVWTVGTQVLVGKGTPVPIAPPRELIVGGPYRLCRNPMMFGGLLYWFGLGVFFGSPRIGVIVALIGFFLGWAYHKLVEERELEARFGDAYREYRAKTPFMLPKL